MRSMNGSRRNSGSSLVSSSSASSNLSHLEEDTWILWGRIANEWEEWRRRKEKLLKVAGTVEVGGQLGGQQGQGPGPGRGTEVEVCRHFQRALPEGKGREIWLGK